MSSAFTTGFALAAAFLFWLPGNLPAPAAAQETERAAPPSAPPRESGLPQARDLRPLPIPAQPPRDSGERLLDRGKVGNERQRLERGRDPHDPFTQDRLRRLDRARDRLR